MQKYSSLWVYVKLEKWSEIDFSQVNIMLSGHVPPNKWLLAIILSLAKIKMSVK